MTKDNKISRKIVTFGTAPLKEGRKPEPVSSEFKKESKRLVPRDGKGFFGPGDYLCSGDISETPCFVSEKGSFFAIDLLGKLLEGPNPSVERILTTKNTDPETFINPEAEITLLSFSDDKNFVKIVIKKEGVRKEIEKNLEIQKWKTVRCRNINTLKVLASRESEIKDLTGLCEDCCQKQEEKEMKATKIEKHKSYLEVDIVVIEPNSKDVNLETLLGIHDIVMVKEILAGSYYCQIYSRRKGLLEDILMALRVNWAQTMYDGNFIDITVDQESNLNGIKNIILKLFHIEKNIAIIESQGAAEIPA